jgi:hypothetical protein
LDSVTATVGGSQLVLLALTKHCTVMQSDAQCIMTSTPSPKTVRVTVPVSPATLATFKRLGEASGTSTGKAMGEWLSDTIEGAEYMANLLAKARQSPKLVVRELLSYALGIGDMSRELMERMNDPGLIAKVKAVGTAGAAVGARSADAGAHVGPSPGNAAKTPPSCNTGGKVPSKQAKRKGKPS